MTAVLAARPKRRLFAGSHDQVKQAREFVARALGACPSADDVVLLTSELVTNAITHTASGNGGHFTVTVYRAGTWVRVARMFDYFLCSASSAVASTYVPQRKQSET